MIFVSVQPFSTTLFGVPFPLPTPQGRRDSQGNTQDMETTSANLFRKDCQGRSETRRPSRPASRIQSSEAIVTSQPRTQLTGGYVLCVSSE